MRNYHGSGTLKQPFVTYSGKILRYRANAWTNPYSITVKLKCMGNITEKEQEFVEWLTELKQLVAENTSFFSDEIKINEALGYKYFESGFTPQECFREVWQVHYD